MSWGNKMATHVLQLQKNYSGAAPRTQRLNSSLQNAYSGAAPMRTARGIFPKQSRLP
jgi:hypothetical protein